MNFEHYLNVLLPSKLRVQLSRLKSRKPTYMILTPLDPTFI